MPSTQIDEACNGELCPAPKRRRGLGIRIIGGRIYDSVNGKTCHQCRQKTIDYMAPCKSTPGSKPCTRNYCAKCLLNRYGEIAVDVAQLNDWRCPRCRGDCNCSICLKKQGKTPTGILTPTARATGFSSVADLLKKCSNGNVEDLAKCTSAVKGSDENSLQTQAVNNATGCHDENVNSGHEEGTASQSFLKHDSTQKKRTLISSAGSGAITPALLAASDKRKAERTNGKKKRDGSDAAQEEKFTVDAVKNSVIGAEEKESSQTKFSRQGVPPSKTKKIKDYLTTSCSKPLGEESDDNEMENQSKKRKSRCPPDATADDVRNMISIVETDIAAEPGRDASSKVPFNKENKTVNQGSNDSGNVENPNDHPRKEIKQRRKIGAFQYSIEEKDIDLPLGTPLVSISGIDFPTEAIGPALQLVEFCSAFKSVLGLRKGDVEAMLRELTKGRLVRKGANSALVQFQAKLLALIVHGSVDMGNAVSFSSGDCKSSWFCILKNHLAEKSTVFMGLPATKKSAKYCDYEKRTDEDGQMHDTVEEAADTSESHSTMSETLEKDLVIIRDAIEGGADGYENLGMYHKLQLLIVLCDDSLETECMRNFIDSAHHEYWEAQKGNREEVLAARKEVKFAKLKRKDAAVARLLASAKVSTRPLSPEEKEALSCDVKAEADKAVAAALVVKEAASRLNKSRNDAVRSDPVVWAPDGRALYRLKGVNDLKSVVVQETDVGAFERDRWFMYSEQEEAVLSKFLRTRATRSRVVAFEEEKENLVPPVLSCA